ncbi:hypothetical protein [Pseudomonas anguilliseptica]|uniref:hypothetical protein n=1 Tax=Pseudomonas anguilliseptica TaxID=53406 RepID=UPI003736365B
MKKIIAASLFAGLFTSAAFASTPSPDITVTLADGYLPVGTLTNKINLARSGVMTARASRAGFVKNNFDFTISANVVAGVNEDAANSRFGVIAGSNKGYVVFTGTSVGGSISQCGALVAKGTGDLAASLVADSNLAFGQPNGCNRQP